MLKDEANLGFSTRTATAVGPWADADTGKRELIKLEGGNSRRVMHKPIFGILQQMKETFESNLSVSQKEETTNQKAYEDLKAAKEEEIAAGQAQVDQKTTELASTDEKLANDKEDLEDMTTGG